MKKSKKYPYARVTFWQKFHFGSKFDHIEVKHKSDWIMNINSLTIKAQQALQSAAITAQQSSQQAV
ncbi:MAG: hypothetical protein IIX34_01875, partial [Alistipes sp.]|nr:hypothetical protein [Alistipes sp.]